MTFKPTAANMIVFYPGTMEGGGQGVVANHGDTGIIASSDTEWTYRSVYVNAGLVFAHGEVDPNNAALNYLGHEEVSITATQDDLTQLFQSSSQFPINYLGIDPTKVVLVWLDIDAQLAAPDAVASSSLVGGCSTMVMTLSLPGRQGIVGFVEAIAGSSLVATCPYGNYNPANGTVEWTGSGTIMLENASGKISLVDQSGFPVDWTFSEPKQQGDGSWVITLGGGVPADDTISHLTATPTSIVNDGVSASVITATVLDGNQQLVSGVNVNWSTSLGTVSPLSSVTNAIGEASTTLTDVGDTGQSAVTALLDNDNNQTVDVTLTQSAPPFIIRGNRSGYRASGQAVMGRLVALDAITLKPVSVDWSYDNGSLGGTGSSFLDISPEAFLNAGVGGKNQVTLNPANILGNGDWMDTSTSAGAFAARLDDGTCVGWGYSSDGGSTPSSQSNYNIMTFSAGFYAFTAIREDQSIFSWGNSAEGGVTPADMLSLKDVQEVRGSHGTFALRTLTSPYIRAWGWGTTGGEETDMSVPSNIASMNDIVSLVANDNAFAVINLAGRVYAWGEKTSGGSVSRVVSELSSITTCLASRRAFAIITGGRIYAWGDTDYGGNSDDVSSITDAVRLVSTESAYTVMRSNGGIICWGNTTYGNSLPAGYKSRTDIVDVKGTYGAFAALCADGSVLTWGNSSYGGDSDSVASQLKNVVALSATAGSFAALTDEGNVVTWGNSAIGGNSAAVAGALYDICAIYANTHAFSALRNDNTVIVWGDAASGTQGIPPALNGNISYINK